MQCCSFTTEIPATTLAEVARNIQRLDASFLAASVVQVTPNYSVLAAPEDPAQSIEVKPEHIEVLLDLAVNHYDFVILDVGRQLDAVTIKALDRAERSSLSCRRPCPFIRDAQPAVVGVPIPGVLRRQRSPW